MEIDLQLQDICQCVAQQNGITDYEVRRNADEKFGEHFISDLTAVSLTGKQHGKTVQIDLIVKVPNTDGNIVNDKVKASMFKRELNAYSKLLKTYDNIQMNIIEDDNALNIIKCYFYRTALEKEVLVLQDMRSHDFVLCNDVFLDYPHITLAMKEIGKLHALSLVMEKQKPDLFATLSEHFTHIMNDEDVYKMLLSYSKNGVEEECKRIQNAGIQKKLCEYYDLWKNKGEHTVGTVKVISHYDAWRSNIFFKYKDGRPHKACLLDFQLMQLHNPAYDILHVVATNTDHKLRKEHFKDLINIYYETLGDCLSKFSIDVRQIYQMKDIMSDIRSMAKFVLVRALFSLRLWHGARLQVSEGCSGLLVAPQHHYASIVDDVIDDFISYENIH